MSATTSSSRVGAGIRAEFPIFETATYLNSCSQGALSHRVRDAVEEWLSGWDANGAEWDFWVERNEIVPLGDRAPAPRRRRRRRGHDVRLPGGQRTHVRAPARR